MTTWYWVAYDSDRITPVEITRETPEYLFSKHPSYPETETIAVKEVSEYGGWFQTYDEAYMYLLSHASRAVEKANAELLKAQSRLEAVLALRKQREEAP